ncbi:GIY-YIG nuclease family protein [Ancylobacter polymorphus]|uniref:GIY-YIG catalytic domain-containing protein n=1 Tax=Ancylobacter polymorphus TaxID=223390 RepID=A0A9E7D7U8_9HYPH|nr:hypothetical protein [Ancylobacter polymorphus]UOK73985.1 hypothetical protein K9D25_24770 [Ancylobacter polymorphus]
MTPAEILALSHKLEAGRRPLADMPLLHGPGVYAFYLVEAGQLAPIEVDPARPLYIGMTDQCLSIRNHFGHAHSGFSTFRRSLGAILKSALGLRAISRSPGSKSTLFRFTDEGEQRLTEWMRDSLQGAQHPIPADALASEKKLIAALHPALNLTDWPNPQRPLIKRFRHACAVEVQQGEGR